VLLEVHLDLDRRWKLRIAGERGKRQQEKNPRDWQCGFHGVAPFSAETRISESKSERSIPESAGEMGDSERAERSGLG
jgi:hypothetical protein